jgi:hypothetical protein
MGTSGMLPDPNRPHTLGVVYFMEEKLVMRGILWGIGDGSTVQIKHD